MLIDSSQSLQLTVAELQTELQRAQAATPEDQRASVLAAALELDELRVLKSTQAAEIQELKAQVSQFTAQLTDSKQVRA